MQKGFDDEHIHRSTGTSVGYTELLMIPASAYHEVASTHFEIKHFISPVLLKEEGRRRAKLRWKRACAQVIMMNRFGDRKGSAAASTLDDFEKKKPLTASGTGGTGLRARSKTYRLVRARSQRGGKTASAKYSIGEQTRALEGAPRAKAPTDRPTAPKHAPGDRVKVIKEGSQQGKQGTVLEHAWAGASKKNLGDMQRVKVAMDSTGAIKSYLPNEIANLSLKAGKKAEAPPQQSGTRRGSSGFIIRKNSRLKDSALKVGRKLSLGRAGKGVERRPSMVDMHLFMGSTSGTSIQQQQQTPGAEVQVQAAAPKNAQKVHPAADETAVEPIAPTRPPGTPTKTDVPPPLGSRSSDAWQSPKSK
jgi:hypothetical protein